ncbi:MAG: 3-phosphoshikimate 1-carboxyvinyltransferase [Candidatus Omnitrophica bacterium]|nr:3-phosphoshikimate 1-carboxyvinyltransferase [Candidatus Omnitrophota bacterium]
MKSYISKPARKIYGQFVPPGDKSISHRAIMLASLASGTSKIANFLKADDCLRTMDAFCAMGVSIVRERAGQVTIKGSGFNGLKSPSTPVDLGNSGTSMRLLLGILATQPFRVVLTGDASLSSRPMKRVTAPLRKMGAKISGKDDANYAPLEIEGGHLQGITHLNEPASAQVKSAILLAGLRASGKTIVREPNMSRDHTERMLEMVGAPIHRKGIEIEISRAERLCAIDYQVPGDISSAAFLMVAAALLPNSDLLIQKVGLNPTRIGILEVLSQMGAQIKWTMDATKNQIEPVGTVHIRGSQLRSIPIDGEMIPRLIDELPILMIACALARGKSIISGAKELRVKETDRIKSMVTGLNAIGGKAEEREDGCVIWGVERFSGGRVVSHGDHRTAMSFSIAGLNSKDPVTIEDIDCVGTSYPSFFDHLEMLSQK